jgi:hypothetical protein
VLTQLPAPQSAFNIDLEYTGDDDALLDWERYSTQHAVRCCGCEWSLPRLPDWWFRFSQAQRRWMVAGAGCLLTFTLLLVGLALAAAAKGRLGRSSTAAAAAAAEACAWSQWRLPPGVVPSHYNLTLDVQMRFPWQVHGEVGIGVNVSRPTSCIVLHAARMQVTDARLGGPAGRQARYRFDPDTEQLALIWEEDVPAGPQALFLTFQYQLSEGLSGFYRSTYALRDGRQYSLAVTQLEANAARAAFPCFDEPALKVRARARSWPPALGIGRCPPARRPVMRQPPHLPHVRPLLTPITVWCVSLCVGCRRCLIWRSSPPRASPCCPTCRRGPCTT